MSKPVVTMESEEVYGGELMLNVYDVWPENMLVDPDETSR